MLDLSWVHGELAPYYPPLGRPSIDPALMIRMLIVGYVFGIRSERALCREVQVNLAYRWFCRLWHRGQAPRSFGILACAQRAVPRQRHLPPSVFERVVEACIAAGLVGGEGFAVDASLIAADANKQRSIPGTEWDKTRAPETASRAMKEYLATLDDAAFGAASDVTPKFVSPSDPAAQWTGAMRGPAFFAYADNYLIDVKFGVIMDVEASRAIRQAEVGAAKTMIERTEAASISSPHGSRPIRPMVRPQTSTGSSTRRGSRRTSRSSTSRSARTAPSVGRTSSSTRSATSISARRARRSRRRASVSADDYAPLSRLACRIVVPARSKRNAAPKMPARRVKREHL